MVISLMQAANSVELFNMERGSMIIQGVPHKVCETSGRYLNLVYNIVMTTKTKKDAMCHN
jgi:hypothetical protein